MSDASQPVELILPPRQIPELPSDRDGTVVGSPPWPQVQKWRRAERQRLVATRMALRQEERELRAGRIAAQLDRTIGRLRGRIIGVYWPFRGEPDLRLWCRQAAARGARLALPVVIRRGWPLEYRIWADGDRLERGVWGIPAPMRGPAVQPDIVIAPLVGVDRENYRLGYGGGFFDRTLAAMPRRPATIGVGYRECRLETIHPQAHDIPMETVLTA